MKRLLRRLLRWWPLMTRKRHAIIIQREMASRLRLLRVENQMMSQTIGLLRAQARERAAREDI